MAKQQLPQPDRVFSIACWNSKGDGYAENRRKVYEYHLKECVKQRSLPDLVFLQEITISDKSSKVRKIQESTIREVLYEGIFEEDNTQGQYNCVLYNKNKFSRKETPELEEAYQFANQQLNPDTPHDLRLSQKSSQTKKLLERHIAIVTLTVEGNTNTEITAVSFHNIYKAHSSEAKLDLLMTLLHQLNKLTGIPVLLAGDFNMEVGDILTRYPPTKHREGLKLIDSIYLIDPMKKFKLQNVEARMISGHSLSEYKWKDFACREDTRKRLIKRGKSWDKTELETMARRDNVSNHDPLIATLELLPSTHIGCYSVLSWNAARTYGTNDKILLDQVLSKEYDLVFLQEVPNQPHLPYSTRYGSVGTTQPESNHECRPWVLFNKKEFKLNECKDDFLCKAWHGLEMKIQCFIEFSREKNVDKTMKSLKEKYPENEKQVKVLLKKIEDDGEFQCKLCTLYNGWTCIKKKDLEPHFALAMVHKISQPHTKSIIAVSFHTGDKNPIPILNLLLYLLEELHDLTGYPILLADDFKINLPEATQNLLLPYIQTEQREQKGPACVDYIMLRDDSKVSWTMDKVTPWEIDVHIKPLRAEDDSQEQIQPALQGTIEQMYPAQLKEIIGLIYPELEEKIIKRIDLEVTKAIRGTIGHNPLVTCLRQWST